MAIRNTIFQTEATIWAPLRIVLGFLDRCCPKLSVRAEPPFSEGRSLRVKLSISNNSVQCKHSQKSFLSYSGLPMNTVTVNLDNFEWAQLFLNEIRIILHFRLSFLTWARVMKIININYFLKVWQRKFLCYFPSSVISLGFFLHLPSGLTVCSLPSFFH